jgi:[acyl-carrier-protein] S-malonyltransferase
MSKTAFVFPGQGSQSVGMAKSFYDSFDTAKKAFDEASEAMSLDMARLCFEGPEELLNRTEYTQPALLAASIAALRVLNEKTSFRPDFFAGHSLGEYTALVASGALDFKEAVRLVHLRGIFMQESVPAGTGKMCAIIGLGLPDVQTICDSASIDSAQVVPANINSPEQIVISGAAAAVDIAAGMAKDRGAKMVVPLQVSAPSHSPLMENAAARLAQELGRITIKDPSTPVYTNVEAEPLTQKARIKELLCLQLTSPVRWVDIVRKMKADGALTIIEVGPGKVLTGLIKRIDKEINTLNLKEAADLEKVSGALEA